METKVILDTSIMVDFTRNKEHAVSLVKELSEKHEVCTTDINVFELYYGAFKSAKKEENIKSITSLLNRIEILNLSHESIKKAAEILVNLEKKGEQIDFRDLLIGTIALVNNNSIKTNNIKHFERIEGLNVI